MDKKNYACEMLVKLIYTLCSEIQRVKSCQELPFILYYDPDNKSQQTHYILSLPIFFTKKTLGTGVQTLLLRLLIFFFFFSGQIFLKLFPNLTCCSALDFRHWHFIVDTYNTAVVQKTFGKKKDDVDDGSSGLAVSKYLTINSHSYNMLQDIKTCRIITC